MLTEDYISFETAKLLKEKGFDVPLNYYYNSDGRSGYATAYNWNQTIGDFPDYSRPTLQMAMKWLREVHNCHICVQALITTDGLQGYCPFCTKVGGKFMWENVLGDDYATAPTHEEAAEAAIRYCLKNLI